MAKQGAPVIILAAITLVISGCCPCSRPLLNGDPEQQSMEAKVAPREWLQRKTTIEEAEQEHLVENKELGPAPVPFGFINGEWKTFKAGIKPGDELWKCSSNEQSWQDLAGRAGICLVRSGRIVAMFVTTLN